MSIFDWLSQRTKKQAVERFMVQLVNKKQFLERTQRHDRQDSRTSASFEMRVLPWGDSPSDHPEEFFTATKDLNLRGVSFVAPVSFEEADQLALSIFVEEEYHHLLGEVKHSTQIGNASYLIGCEILTTLESSPELTVRPRSEISNT